MLAAVTSLPNAVAAVYLAARGRGAATLSTALNSNTLNIALGLLLPAAVVGLGKAAGETTIIAAWYIGLTAVTLGFAYRDRGLRRATGLLVIAAYVVFAGSVLVPAQQPGWSWITVSAGTVSAVTFVVVLASGRRRSGGSGPPGSQSRRPVSTRVAPGADRPGGGARV